MKYKKIGAGLLAAFEDLQSDGPAALAGHTRTLGIATVTGTQKPPRAIVFVHCDAEARLDDLAAAGIHFNQARGLVRTAFLPLERLGELSEHSQVKRIVASRRLRPRMDVAPQKVKLPEFKNRTDLTGQGIVIGVVDTGIDPNHADFKGRILSIWDQTLSGPGVAEGAYGLELTGNQITASRDTNGHGTHVAGIAAGAGTRFQGVAASAELVIVKTTFQDAHIADAIRYVFRVAKNLGKPVVVNLSLGGHSDPHDGTDSLSQVIDEESGPGRIVCCAAGNEGDDNIHARVALGAPATRTLRFVVPKNSAKLAELNAWYPGSGKLEVSITSPDGFATPFQPVIATGNFLKKYTLPTARVVVETPDTDPENGDRHVVVQIRSATPGAAVPSGTWQLRVKNTARFAGQLDVWTLDDQDAPQVVCGDSHVADSLKIGSPGSAAGAVTVGAFVTRNAWKDIDGNDQAVGLTLGTIAGFSSEGPLRNKQRKPDVTAPGAMIASCLSNDSAPERAQIVDRQHFAEAGTSMASPFIAGVVALLLERNPALDPAAVKAALKKASKIPGKAAGAFDPKWGFGLLNAAKL
ncbi:MAG: peptidase S8 [Planctomycetaceae bacterium]|nr:peptidase S8 [Planctomycetaceae bacterium]